MAAAHPSNSRLRSLDEICRLCPVIAVLTVRDVTTARDLAESLVAGGVRVLEITLRSPEALEAIRIMSEVRDAIVGAGTIVSVDQVREVVDAGAVFGVSPGFSPAVLSECRKAGLPLLPGVSTATEVMSAPRASESTSSSSSPAEAAGGRAMLRSLFAPFPDMRFCPTGGLTEHNTADYLGIPNVICTGGSWVAPAPAVKGRDWERNHETCPGCRAASLTGPGLSDTGRHDCAQTLKRTCSTSPSATR